MDNPLARQVIANLTLPLQPATPFPSVPSGHVWLFADGSWSSPKLDLNINDYTPGRRQTLPRSMHDNAEWIAFNLPVGVVMTLMDNVTTGDGKPVADISGCAGTIDLVGNNTVKGAKLVYGNLNDAISGFFWRRVDMSLGALEIFQDGNFSANFYTFFLSEWPRDQIHSMADWWMNDKASSIRWRSISDRCTVTLYEHSDGSGRRYDNVKGWGSFKEIANLGDYSFNDCFSALMWTALLPKREVMDPIMIPSTTGMGDRQYISVQEGANRTELVQGSSVSLTVQEAQTLQVDTTDTHQVGMTVNMTQTEKVGVEGVGSAETAVSIGFSYDYTHSQTISQSTNKSIALNLTHNFSQPIKSTFKATLIVGVGTYPVTQYTTRAVRWYDMPVRGGVQDPQNSNWYKREETVTFMIGGNLVTSTKFNIEATKIPGLN